MKTTKARLVLVYISTFLIGLVFTNLSYSEIDPESVVGMWLLDEGKETTAKDSSREENDGTLMEGPKWVNGKFGAALEFDGTDDYVSAGDADGLSGGAGKKLTVVAWFNPGKVSGGQNPIVVKYLSAGEKDWGLLVSNGQLRFGYETKGNNWEMDSPLLGGEVSVNTWYHAAFVLDGIDVKLYLNGAEVGAVTLPTDTPDTAAHIEVGGTSYRGDYFKGIIDEVAVFNVALTQKDIQTIMKRGLQNALSGVAVQPSGKLGITWATIKSEKKN